MTIEYPTDLQREVDDLRTRVAALEHSLATLMKAVQTVPPQIVLERTGRDAIQAWETGKSVKKAWLG